MGRHHEVLPDEGRTGVQRGAGEEAEHELWPRPLGSSGKQSAVPVGRDRPDLEHPRALQEECRRNVQSLHLRRIKVRLRVFADFSNLTIIIHGFFCSKRKLIPWLRLILRNQTVIETFYTPWSYVAKTGTKP